MPAGLKLVDLRSPRRIVSPFVLTVEDEIGLLRSDIAFLERLGEELIRPIVPQGASIDYVSGLIPAWSMFCVRHRPVCTKNSDSNVVVMKTTEDCT